MKRTAITALVLALVACAIWARPLFLGETFLLRDHVSATLPSRAFLGASLAEGEIPEWWPAVGLGSSFAANPNHGVTYPPAWIVALVPSAWGADLLLVLHAWFGALGVAMLSRRLGAGVAGERLAGAAFAASGYVGSIFINAIPLLTLAWTPWVAAAAVGLRERPSWRAMLPVVACAAPQIASGDPAGMITSALVSAAIVLPSWRGLGLLVVSWIAAVVVAAVAVLPALHLLGESERAGGLATELATTWSMHPLRLVALIWPRALGDVTEPALDLGELAASGHGPLTGGWALGVYLGLPVILLAARSDRRGLLLAATFLLLLALGRFTPFYEWWRFGFLPERLIRYPEKHLAGVVVLITALAGVGVTQRPCRRLWWALGVSTAILGAAVLARPLVDLSLPGKDMAAALAEVTAGGLVAIVSLVGLGFALHLSGRTRLGPALVFLAVIAPMISESLRLQMLGPRALVVEPTAFLVPHVIPAERGAAPRGAWPRLYRPQDFSLPVPVGQAATGILAHVATAVPNVAAQHGVAYAPGYDPALASRLHRLWDAAVERGAGARLLNLLGVEWAILTPEYVGQSGLRPVVTSANGRVVLVANPTARPRAFTTDRWAEDPDEETLREQLLARTHDASTVRVVAHLGTPPGRVGLQPCALEATEADRAVLHCQTDGPALAVLLDAWAPGWTVTVDGEAEALHRVDSVVRGVLLETAGAHTIVHQYRTPGLRLGFWITVGSIVVLLGLAYYGANSRDST